jgi:hypothetical protein
MNCCAGVAWWKGNIRKNYTKYSVEQGACKEQTFGKGHCMKLKGSHNVKN